MTDWNTDFNQISIHYAPHMIQLKTDAAMFEFLGADGNGSVELARHIRSVYQEQYGMELNISENSLAIEILLHVYIDKVSRVIEKSGDAMPGPLKRLLVTCMQKINVHTEIIDSGEREVDPNRFVFDDLAPFARVIYALFGKYA